MFAIIARVVVLVLLAGAGAARAQDVLPRPEQPFDDSAGLTPRDSPPPHWPAKLQAPKGAPNILLIMTDDVGFSAGSTFGGPIPTPAMDALARDGLKYTEFHVTAVCSATRAALLTGRNHHEVGMGGLPEAASGYDGYTSFIPRSAGTLAQILQQNGYSTAQIGKWHLTPARERSLLGPFDHWPTRMGFDYSYGFLGGETNQWAPELFEGITPVEPGRGDPTYHFDRDMADHAIAWIRRQKSLTPATPFFLYYAPGTSHSPHQAPADWIARFKGQFDRGWDRVREETFERQKKLGIIPPGTRLTPRPASIPAWDTLSQDQKTVYAHEMEVYAGALAHCDDQIGRVVQALRDMDILDDTLVIYIQGDNGASGLAGANGSLNDVALYNLEPEDFQDFKRRMNEMGGPNTRSDYPAGWGHAMNTPFQWYKAVASHFGGTRDGMVLSWPRHIKAKGEIRTQFHHVIDVMPTILDVTGIPAPRLLFGAQQQPIEGLSMAYSFDNANAPSVRTTQYFEMFGNLAIYHDGWVAATTPLFNFGPNSPRPAADDLENRPWELYHISEDFSEADNLAAKEPDRLRELRNLLWVEAARNHVLPIHLPDYGGVAAMTHEGQKSFTYYPGTVLVPQGSAPAMENKSFEIAALVDIPASGADGMLATQGGRFGGFAFYMLQGKLVYCYNFYNMSRYTVTSSDRLPPGKHTLSVKFTYDGGGLGKGGNVTLLSDGKVLAEGRIDRTSKGVIEALDETFDVGEDHGTAINDAYEVPFKFTGGLEKVMVTLQ